MFPDGIHKLLLLHWPPFAVLFYLRGQESWMALAKKICRHGNNTPEAGLQFQPFVDRAWVSS